MNKTFNKVLTLTGIFVLLLFTSKIYAASNMVDVSIDGKYLSVETMDQPPILQNGSVLVPIRTISENLGAKVDWDESSKKITIESQNTKIEMFINQKNVKVNGITKTVDVPATVTKANRTIVPLRFINENLGYDVQWSQKNKAAHIFTHIHTKDEIATIVNNHRYVGLKHNGRNLPSHMKDFGGMLIGPGTATRYGVEYIEISGQGLFFLDELLYNDENGYANWIVRDVIVIPEYSKNQGWNNTLIKNGVYFYDSIAIYENEDKEYIDKVYKVWNLDVKNGKLKEVPVGGIRVVNEGYNQ